MSPRTTTPLRVVPRLGTTRWWWRHRGWSRRVGHGREYAGWIPPVIRYTPKRVPERQCLKGSALHTSHAPSPVVDRTRRAKHVRDRAGPRQCHRRPLHTAPTARWRSLGIVPRHGVTDQCVGLDEHADDLFLTVPLAIHRVRAGCFVPRMLSSSLAQIYKGISGSRPWSKNVSSELAREHQAGHNYPHRSRQRVILGMFWLSSDGEWRGL